MYIGNSQISSNVKLENILLQGSEQSHNRWEGCFQILLQHYIPEFYYKGQRLPEAISIEGRYLLIHLQHTTLQIPDV